ncbi:hypothetical protein CSHISOI_11084 [Colletotrichum shisoi]|uniref:Uncharacterized protein n=1 Tax=Colletotrichum shisoi TaxID=2078593 RepID=A0A5Q4BCB9_9PEZI|nr:hypothetical protein CSHISOI_11084 [Colletotrichum shisoi]
MTAASVVILATASNNQSKVITLCSGSRQATMRLQLRHACGPTRPVVPGRCHQRQPGINAKHRKGVPFHPYRLIWYPETCSLPAPLMVALPFQRRGLSQQQLRNSTGPSRSAAAINDLSTPFYVPTEREIIRRGTLVGQRTAGRLERKRG